MEELLEKELHIHFADESLKFNFSNEENEQESQEILSSIKSTLASKTPVIIKYIIKSPYPVDFQSNLLEQIAALIPEVKISCIHLSDNDIVIDKFDWRTKKAFINVTDSLKELSKCTRLKVCCIIVKNNRIISTGVNGTPKGFRNCCEEFPLYKRNSPSYIKEHHKFSDAYEVHAEQNAILELGRNTSIDNYEDLELFCSTCPCPGCAKLIAQSGIKKVYYAHEYDRLPEGAKNLQAFGIDVYKI